MNLIREESEFLISSCKKCSKEHKIKKVSYFKTTNDYKLITAINCDCGNISDIVDGGTNGDENQENAKDMSGFQSLIWGIGCLAVIVVVVILLLGMLIKGCSAIFDSSYEKKDFKDITRQEYNDFMKWDRKQQEKKWDNEKMFGN